MAKGSSEAIEIYKGCCEVLRECRSVSSKVRSLLHEVLSAKRKLSSRGGVGVVGNILEAGTLRESFNVAPVMDEMRALLSNRVQDLTARFQSLAKEGRAGCRRTAFHRAHHQIKELRK